MTVLARALAFGIPALAAVLLFVYTKVKLEGPDSPIVVVDRRTMKLAVRRIAEAIAAENYLRASVGLKALTIWLNYESETGPKRHRAQYTRMLESAAETRSLVNTHVLVAAL
jgi:hypothetical protein